MGMAFATIKNFPQAIQEINEAVKLAPQEQGIRNALSLFRMAEGSYPMAIEGAQMAIRLNPLDLQAVHLFGQPYLRQKDISQAKKVCEAIVKHIPQDPVAHCQLGDIDREAINMTQPLVIT